jgi:hypothetical protein
LLVVAVGATSACAATAGATGERSSAAGRTSGSALVGTSPDEPRRGLRVRAESSKSSLRRISIRFDRGVAIRLKRRDTAYDFAHYHLGESRDTVQFGGRLQVPPGKASGRFALRFRSIENDVTQPAKVRAVLRTGSRPSLVISGLPESASAFSLDGVGAGRRGTRATVCERSFVRYAGTMWITLRSGARTRGDATGGFTCSNLPPARCTC